MQVTSFFFFLSFLKKNISFNSRIIALQYCDGFHIYQHELAIGIHVALHPESPHHLPPTPYPRALALGALLHATNSHCLSILHKVIYMFQCCSLNASNFWGCLQISWVQLRSQLKTPGQVRAKVFTFRWRRANFWSLPKTLFNASLKNNNDFLRWIHVSFQTCSSAFRFSKSSFGSWFLSWESARHAEAPPFAAGTRLQGAIPGLHRRSAHDCDQVT